LSIDWRPAGFWNERRVPPIAGSPSLTPRPLCANSWRKQAPKLLAQPLVIAMQRASSEERDLIVRGLETLQRVLQAGDK